VISMPPDRQLLNFIVEKELLDRVDDFRFQNRFATRAGAIKWLLDWATRQNPHPTPARSQAVRKSVDAVALPAIEAVSAALPSALPSQPPLAPAFKPEPSHESAIEALRSQGYEVGETFVQDGHVRMVVRSDDGSALVTVGKELHELAAGRLTLAQVGVRRRSA
jgi:hypothetical protein